MLVDPEPADVVSGRAHARSKSTLTRFNPALVGKLVGTPGVPSLSMEQYRKVAATLHHLQLERGVKVIMVSSAVPSEGKTLTATNLALTLSESYRRKVLIIDADLRRPTLHQIFDLPNISGLNDGLKADIDRPLPLVQVSQTLTVLTAGRPDPDPMSGLTSSRMKRVIEEAQGFAEWVIVDTPPVGLLPDARLLSNMVDGALLVIRAGRSPFELVRRAVEGLGHDRILGVVFNDVQDVNGRASGYYGYGGYYYGPREKP
jgi:capsular exopolysaccharide synthesis family protein